MFVILMKYGPAMDKPRPIAVNLDTIATVRDIPANQTSASVSMIKVTFRDTTDDGGFIVAFGTLALFKECLFTLNEGHGRVRGYVELLPDEKS